MQPVQTPSPTNLTPDHIRARANIVNAVVSFDLIAFLFRIFGYKPSYLDLSDAQKKIFDNTHPILGMVVYFLSLIRQISATFMMLSTVLMLLPAAGFAYGLFGIIAPYLIPIIVIGTVCLLISYLLDSFVFIYREYALSHPVTSSSLALVKSLEKGQNNADLAINEVKNILHQSIFDPHCSPHVQEDIAKLQKRISEMFQKNIKILDSYQDGFLNQSFRELLLKVLSEQLENGESSLSSKTAQHILMVQNAMCCKSMDHTIADFVYFDQRITDLCREMKMCLKHLQTFCIHKSISPTKLNQIHKVLDQFDENCNLAQAPIKSNGAPRSPRSKFKRLLFVFQSTNQKLHSNLSMSYKPNPIASTAFVQSALRDKRNKVRSSISNDMQIHRKSQVRRRR
ncbi:MAG: hypothetical protein VX112_00060 [Pseudomonadota bacterium]|nr:hypothetical protein [Pseudomonadota bacterium]